MNTNLRTIDANLLVALDALLTAGSVTGAAQAMGVTQPAMSQTLGRLRALLGDPLLVRQGNRMLPTALAERLAEPLHRQLEDLSRLISEGVAFDPKTSTARFVVATTDVVAAALLRGLSQTLLQEAPLIELTIASRDTAQTAAGLRSGEIDIALGVFQTDPGAGFRIRTAYTEHFTSVIRQGHPMGPPPWPLDEWVAWPHGLVGTSGRGPGAVDRALARLGQQRRVMFRMPYFLAALEVIKHADVIFTLPSRIADLFEDERAVWAGAPPVDLDPFRISLLWHERRDRAPGHAWLRDHVAEALKNQVRADAS